MSDLNILYWREMVSFPLGNMSSIMPAWAKFNRVQFRIVIVYLVVYSLPELKSFWEGVAYSVTIKTDCASTGSLLRKISYRKAQFMPVPGIIMLLSLLPLQHTDMIAAHGHRYRYHRLKQLDRDLFMRLIDPFYSCFLSFERS